MPAKEKATDEREKITKGARDPHLGFRLPQKMLDRLDSLVSNGQAKTRSEAARTILCGALNTVMNKEQYAIHEVLLDFARRHLTSRGVFNPYASPEEIDEIVQRIDEARGIGEEPDEGPDQLTPGAGELAKVLVSQARAATYALKKSAYADVVGAISECERLLGETSASPKKPDEVDRRNRLIRYLKTLRAFEAGLAADLGVPGAAV